MNDLLDDDDHAPLARNERELTLSTGTILGIFLGLVVLCGACFGIGYNMGHKAAPAPLAINDNLGGEPAADVNASPKPPAGSPAESIASTPAPTVVTPPAPKPAPIVRRPPPAPAATEDAEDTAATPAPRSTAASASPAVHNVPPSALMPGASGTAPAGAGTIMVQVAAVSHQDDANLLLGALRARGYTVSARSSASDGFIHVQVGPFSNKKDAEAMRQRLITDGYNAILK